LQHASSINEDEDDDDGVIISVACKLCAW